MTVSINAMYASTLNGSGVFTRNVMEVMPELRRFRYATDPSRYSRTAYLRKLAWEASLRVRVAGPVFHPYLAAASDSHAFITVLDDIDLPSTHLHVRRLLARSINKARGVAAISTSQASLLAGRFQRDFSLLTPFPERPFFEMPKQGGTVNKSGVFEVGYWGGYHPRKRTSLLRTISASLPQCKVRLLHDETAGKLQHKSSFEVAHFVDQLDVAVYPSFAEGFGLPPFEALLRNKPVVVQPLQEYTDYMQLTGPGVFLFEDGDQNGFIRAIEAACDYSRSTNAPSPRDSLHEVGWAAVSARLREQFIKFTHTNG